MKKITDEKNILNIIRFGPILFIIFLSILITQIILYQNQEDLKKEIKIIEDTYIKDNKLRVKEEIERVYQDIVKEREKSEELLKQRIKNRVYKAYNIATNIYN